MISEGKSSLFHLRFKDSMNFQVGMSTRRDGVGSKTAGGMNSCRFLLCCRIRCTTDLDGYQHEQMRFHTLQQQVVSSKLHHLFRLGSQLLSFKSLNDEPRDFPSMFTYPKRPAPLPGLRVGTIRGRRRIGAELPPIRTSVITKSVTHAPQ